MKCVIMEIAKFVIILNPIIPKSLVRFKNICFAPEKIMFMSFIVILS